LSPADKQILAPLAPDWDQWDAQRKQKWLGIAKRYPTLGPTEQQRVQQQMRAWAQLTPAQRQAAREQYKTLKQLPPEQRAEVRQKWQEYQQLPPEKRSELATPTPPPGQVAKPATIPATAR
jgi:acyl-CoA reductase-like NAD-dependent aldehyde dehydrogenase